MENRESKISFDPYEKWYSQKMYNSTHEVIYYNPIKDISSSVFAESYDQSQEIKRELEANGFEVQKVAMTDYGRKKRGEKISKQKEIKKSVNEYGK